MSKGAFVWYDLMTTDPEAAREFYSKVMGWQIAEFPGGAPGYRMFMNGEVAVGGSQQLADEARQMGAPTHWLGYVATPDADAAVAKVKELGGNVLADAFDLPDVGRFAVVQDPQGAVFAVFQPAGEMTAPEPGVGQVSWHELVTTDHESAAEFYSALVGWNKTEAIDMGEGWMYQLWRRPGSPYDNGGMYTKDEEQQPGPPAWLYYFGVDDIDAAVNRVKDAGGQVLNGPMEVPGGDRVAQCMDPQGGMFALHVAAG